MNKQDYINKTNRIYLFDKSASDIIDLYYELDKSDEDSIELIEEIKEIIEDLMKVYNL